MAERARATDPASRRTRERAQSRAKQAQRAAARIAPEKKAVIAGAVADLDARDPDYIRSQLPVMWLLATIYFRAEVRGLERVPEEGPVLFVSNHSGGNMTPDSMVFMLAFNTYFGVDRPVYALAHSLVTSWPVIGALGRRWGVITAGRDATRAALARGSCVLVYPGGDVDAHRPWTARHEIRFDGRTGFLEVAKETGVPIVPIVATGGHDTFVSLTDGRFIAKTLRLDRLARLKVLPVSLALPWGLNVGDFVGHVPLPAKIRMEVLPPIDVRALFGDDAASEAAYEYVTTRMQEALTALAAERVLPPFL